MELDQKGLVAAIAAADDAYANAKYADDDLLAEAVKSAIRAYLASADKGMSAELQHPIYDEIVRSRSKELYQKLGRDATLRQNDPVQTIYDFAWSIWADGFGEGMNEAALSAPAVKAEATAELPELTAHDLAMHAYEATGGPTPELRRVYQAYLDNQKKSSPIDRAEVREALESILFEDSNKTEAQRIADRLKARALLEKLGGGK